MEMVRNNHRARVASLSRVPHVEQLVLHASILALALSAVLIRVLG
jgi:hypothetical protein